MIVVKTGRWKQLKSKGYIYIRVKGTVICRRYRYTAVRMWNETKLNVVCGPENEVHCLGMLIATKDRDVEVEVV